MPRKFGDEGAIGLLSLGMAMLALTVILVVSAATAVHAERMRLATAADTLALDAADSLDLAAYYTSVAGDAEAPADHGVQLSPDRMSEVVNARLTGGSAQFKGVQVIAVTTPDGTTAVVTVGKLVRPLFGIEVLLPFVDGIPMTATARARAF